MFCFRYRRLINLELDGRLPDHRVPALESHLSRCPACRAYREELGLGRRLLAATTTGPSPAFEWTLQLRLNRALQEAAGREDPLGPARISSAPWWRRLAVSSVAGAAVTLALVFWLLPGPPEASRQPAPVRPVNLAAAGSRQAVPSPVSTSAGARDRRSLAAPDLFGTPSGGLGRLASSPRYWDGGLVADTSPSLVSRLLRENEILRSQILLLQSRNRTLQALLAAQRRDTVAVPGSGGEEP